MRVPAFTGRNRRSASLWFDQAPDFVIPNEFNPRIVSETKPTEDHGTARNKVA